MTVVAALEDARHQRPVGRRADEALARREGAARRGPRVDDVGVRHEHRLARVVPASVVYAANSFVPSPENAAATRRAARRRPPSRAPCARRVPSERAR